MALIACPECDQQVSDRARACPGCGFPVAEEIGRALAEVTGFDRVRSVRQRLAADKLKSWSERYVQDDATLKEPRETRGFLHRHQRLIVVGVILVIVILQLAALFTAVQR